MPTRIFSIGFCTVLAVLALAIPRHAHAQGFISPLLGYDFGGDSGCPNITGCEDKKLNFGVGVGSLGSFIGGEFEFAYAKDFFGKAPNYKSSVMTFMGNLLIGPKIGPVQPYGAGGVGLIKTNVDFTPTSLLDSNNNHFGWDIGGGLIVFLGDHVGVRGDIRHFHAFQDLDILGVTLGDTKLDFGRASGALVLKF
jgi:opacity protein-like surface antigen